MLADEARFSARTVPMIRLIDNLDSRVSDKGISSRSTFWQRTVWLEEQLSTVLYVRAGTRVLKAVSTFSAIISVSIRATAPGMQSQYI
jgi:hypothetical protein